MVSCICFTLVLGHLALQGQSIIMETADSLYAVGNYTKAINYYAEDGGENSGLQIARAYNAVGNYDKAIAQYQGVIEKHPEGQIAKFELGKLLLRDKQYEVAEKLFSQLIFTGSWQR